MARPIICQYCQRAIQAESYGVHITKCMRRVIEQSRKHEQEKLLYEKENRKKKDRDLKQGKEQNGKTAKRVSWQEEQKFSCYLCDELFPIKDLDVHSKQCKNREIKCEKCDLVFPKNLMPDHKLVCDGIKQQEECFDTLGQDLSDTSSVTSLPLYDNDQLKQAYLGKRARIDATFAWQNRNRLYLIDKKLYDKEIYKFRTRKTQQQSQVYTQSYEQYQKDLNELRKEQDNLHERRFILNTEQARIKQQREKSQMYEKRKLKKKWQRENKPKRYRSNGRDIDTCSICCLDFIHREKVKDIPCGHLFHVHCINEWLMRSKDCPICKRVLQQPEEKPEEKGRDERPGYIYTGWHIIEPYRRI